MKFTPRAFQQAGIDHAVEFLRSAARDERVLYASPTGSGKSVVILGVQEQLEDCWIICPREEIIDGMLEKLQFSGTMEEAKMCTPVRLRNRLLEGKIRNPKYLIFDESHHHNADTWQQLDLLTGLAPAVGFTATPYRGSPRGTREFLERWGDPVWLITLEEAAAEGYIKLPTFEVLPLVDDDVIEVKGGDFDITSIESATVDRLGDLAEQCSKWYSNGKWDMATVFSMPNSLCCNRAMQEFTSRGLPVVIVSANTPKNERWDIFRAVEAGVFALFQINIVSEGVDLKLRRLVDVAPTMSPVKWVQQLGRVTRPWDSMPQYVCTNRNLMRHAYALEGAVSVSALVEAEKRFGTTERGHARVLGLEAIGRFKPVNTKLSSGLTLSTYALSTMDGGTITEYCVLVHPAMEPIWATKTNTIKDGVRTWGTWQKCDPPKDVRGFSSVGPKELSEKQKAWWDRSAARFGLDPTQEVNRKSFQALPVLSDLGLRLQ